MTDKMSILILVLVLNVVVVKSSTVTFGEFLEYLVADQHITRNDEPVEQSLRLGSYDLANDPDPIIENLPPNLDNLIFLTNLSKVQLNDLIEEAHKNKEIVDSFDSEEESSGHSDDFQFEETMEEKDENDEYNEHEENKESTIIRLDSSSTTNTSKLIMVTKSPITTTEPPGKYNISANTSFTSTKAISTKPSTTQMPPRTITKQSSSLPLTSTLEPLINRIIPAKATDEITSSEVDEIEEVVDEDSVDKPEESFTEESELTFIEPITTKKPTPVKPNKPKPNKRPTKKPNRRPRPGKRPGRRPNKRPIIIHVGNKGSKWQGIQKPIKININPSKQSINKIQKGPLQDSEHSIVCPYQCRK